LSDRTSSHGCISCGHHGDSSVSADATRWISVNVRSRSTVSRDTSKADRWQMRLRNLHHF